MHERSCSLHEIAQLMRTLACCSSVYVKVRDGRPRNTQMLHETGIAIASFMSIYVLTTPENGLGHETFAALIA